MADAELPHVGWPTGLPVPRPPAHAGDGLPGTHREWVTALGQVSGLLCTLREAEAPDGTVVLPVPLAHGVALRAWTAVARPVRTGGGTTPVDLPLACAPVLINPERRRPERRVHLLDDELDERWWIESDDAVAADELLLGAHAHLRATVLPPGWRVTIDGRGPAVVCRGDLTPTAAENVRDLLVGLAAAAPEAMITPSRAPGTRR